MPISSDVWKEGLDPDQIPPSGHIGVNALLISGPGTGKTRILTQRVLALLLKHGVDPQNALVLTFTRMASYELRERTKKVLTPLGMGEPYISTLHSFALRQLLKNSARIDSLPTPLRIADDWEERYIIFENLKEDLLDHLKRVSGSKIKPIDKIRKLFNQLSSDWETLRIERDESQRMCRDARFIGAWNEHRNMFGYTLRSELVYQLKKALEQIDDFELEKEFQHILIDEYQDLNSCDLAVVEELSKKGGELFVAGDDDQSIYGFRYADPMGIRIYQKQYQAKRFDLEICHRCDRSILDLAEYIAELDYKREPKKTRPREDAEVGEVRLLRFRDQYSEAKWVAEKCGEILHEDKNASILILMRSDRRKSLSTVLRDALEGHEVPVAVETGETPLDTYEGRLVLATIRLAVDPEDSLAWYTLLHLETGIGPKTLTAIRNIAKENRFRFYDAAKYIRDNPAYSPSAKVLERLKAVDEILNTCKIGNEELGDQVNNVIECFTDNDNIRETLEVYFDDLISESDAESLSDLLRSISASMGFAEQEFEEGVVNIMTMHKAKGLSADVVFIVGAEKQFIPGKNIVEADDERRLFYVSLTRARHSLFITHCKDRIEQQKWTGSESGTKRRDLTPFLRDGPLTSEYLG